MTDVEILNIAGKALLLAAKLAAPMLITALVIGFAVSLLQALTQVQDSTLAFVPKIIAVGIALLICGNWMVSEIVNFTRELFTMVPMLLGHG